MAKMNMIQALNSALDVMLERDPNVLIFGEDVGYFGGVFALILVFIFLAQGPDGKTFAGLDPA